MYNIDALGVSCAPERLWAAPDSRAPAADRAP